MKWYVLAYPPPPPSASIWHCHVRTHEMHLRNSLDPLAFACRFESYPVSLSDVWYISNMNLESPSHRFMMMIYIYDPSILLELISWRCPTCPWSSLTWGRSRLDINQGPCGHDTIFSIILTIFGIDHSTTTIDISFLCHCIEVSPESSSPGHGSSVHCGGSTTQALMTFPPKAIFIGIYVQRSSVFEGCLKISNVGTLKVHCQRVRPFSNLEMDCL